MFRPSMLAIFRLYMKHLTISYIYTWVGVQFVGWGGCETSFCVCRRGVDRVCLGVLLKYRSCLLMSISRLHFWYVSSYIGKTILHGNEPQHCINGDKFLTLVFWISVELVHCKRIPWIWTAENKILGSRVRRPLLHWSGCWHAVWCLQTPAAGRPPDP